MYKLTAFLTGVLTFAAGTYLIQQVPDTLSTAAINELIAFAPSHKNTLVTFYFHATELLSAALIAALGLIILRRLSSFAPHKASYFSGQVFVYVCIFSFALFFMAYDVEGIVTFGSRILFGIAGIGLVWFASEGFFIKPAA